MEKIIILLASIVLLLGCTKNEDLFSGRWENEDTVIEIGADPLEVLFYYNQTSYYSPYTAEFSGDKIVYSSSNSFIRMEYTMEIQGDELLVSGYFYWPYLVFEYNSVYKRSI